MLKTSTQSRLAPTGGCLGTAKWLLLTSEQSRRYLGDDFRVFLGHGSPRLPHSPADVLGITRKEAAYTSKKVPTLDQPELSTDSGRVDARPEHCRSSGATGANDRTGTRPSVGFEQSREGPGVERVSLDL